jgi:hypothetical protein
VQIDRDNAMKTAKSDFKLFTPKLILRFIANSGLENLKFIRAKSLEKNPFPDEVIVDSYQFTSGLIYGYLAFYRYKTYAWYIKSFKKNTETDVRNFPFKDALIEFSKK